MSSELLRFSTAGSVDDGKSTLIGRLLYDSKSIFEDQMESLRLSSQLSGNGKINLANLTDGLRAEREQGITIDVAHRFFCTPRRKFIVMDCPGHAEYTRNMITGISTAQATVILIDVRHGVVQQTRRHAYISLLMRVPHLIVCINKMDLVGYSQSLYLQRLAEIQELVEKMHFEKVTIIPVSALLGDNIVTRSVAMQWYEGPTLIDFLERVPVDSSVNQDFRFPIQCVIRPHAEPYHDFRGLAGQIASGSVRRGDPVVFLPSGKRSEITGIRTFDGDLESASAPQSVTLLIRDQLDIGRGELTCLAGSPAQTARELDATICWMGSSPLRIGGKYILRNVCGETRCLISEVKHQIDIMSFLPNPVDGSLKSNDLGRVTLKLLKPTAYDPFKVNRYTGSFVLIDEATHETAAAGMIDQGKE